MTTHQAQPEPENLPEEGPEQAETQEFASTEELLAAVREEYEVKLSEAKDQMLRAVAEAENVRRRAQRDVEETSKFAVSSFARELITVAETLFMALQSVPQEEREKEGLLKTLSDGVDMTLRNMLTAFEKQGIQRIDPLGEKFDHNLHQAISQVEDPTKDPNTILHVMQCGYTIKDRLLRPAMVVVSKQGDAAQKVNTQV